MPTNIDTDYLVIGAGAMGMAFVDTLCTETDAHITLVDRYGQPGGHWTTAYPFVRLHQPSTFYGVNSRDLGVEHIDVTGWNSGLNELASAAEVCAYFDQVMQQQLVASGRVDYFPMCDYLGEGRFKRIVTGDTCQVSVRKRIVDATYMRVIVPSMRAPSYAVAPGITCVPLNDLPRLRSAREHYTVVGAGKTGMDACLWLLKQSVAPGAIRWIMPRDSWLLDRARIQPGTKFVSDIVAGIAAQVQAIDEAADVESLFDALEACGQLLRLSPEVRPTKYKCATVTKAELEQLRRIDDVVRLGRLQRIASNRIVLEQGEVAATPDTLYVDCSADGLERRTAAPIFAPGQIRLQSVRTCQQVFSAAFIAHVEAAYPDDETRNRLCNPVPHPDSDLDFLRTNIDSNRNEICWAEDDAIQRWLNGARLQMMRNLRPREVPSLEVRRHLATNMQRQSDKLEAFLKVHLQSDS